MQAAAAYVTELGIEPRIATAAAEWLAQLRDEGRGARAEHAGSDPGSRGLTRLP